MSALTVASINLRFGGLQALADVSVAVAPGERRLLIGPNGAGKTTLFNVISGIYRPNSGSIALGERDVTRLRVHERARLGMARTFQITRLFVDLTVAENVRLAVAAAQRIGLVLHRSLSAYRDCAARTGELLAEWGLAQRSGARVRELSYGEQRQVDLVLAMALEPQVLLLDEPLSGLSTGESAQVVSMIRRLPRTTTILMIEHDMDVAFALADRISVLHLGRLMTEGTPDEVRRDGRVNEIYLGAEAS